MNRVAGSRGLRRLLAALACTLVASVVLLGRPAMALERRVALVVGAAAYVGVPHLTTTKADANSMAEALRRLGFDVDLVLDPDRGALEAAVRRLGERASGADAALFYFAGHGLEVAGRNWLLPISARPQRARDLPFEALDLGLIFDQLDGAARVSLFILDSCRDSPFRLLRESGSRGVAAAGMRAQQAASGSLIAYATAPGSEAAEGTMHSPFTAGLLKYMERPGLTVQQVLNAVRGEVRAATHGQQIPWESSALEGDFFFVQSAAASPAQVLAANPVAGSPPPAPAAAAEELFFRSIADSRQPDELRAFLQRFPNGTYAPLVRIWLQRPAPAAPNERLAEALQKALPGLSAQARQGLAKRFSESPAAGRAIAVHPATGARAEASALPSDAAAETYALERCEYRAGRPCALIAVGLQVFAPDESGVWRPRDTGLLRYAGLFEPGRLPLQSAAVRARADVVGYRALAGPKAAALRPDAFYVAAAATQRDAEQRALEACNQDSARGDAVCYLYAIGDGVVLPRWYASPATPSSQSAAPTQLERLSAAASLAGPVAARIVGSEYANEKPHKAIAVNLPTGLTFRWNGAPNAETAERWDLEGCELAFNDPCVLLGVDDEARVDDPRTATPADMDRLSYAGPFRLDRVPIGMERHEAVRNYLDLPGEKAIAIRPKQALVLVVSGKGTVAEAEREAMDRCNAQNDPAPCFLYARGNEVVLPRRRVEIAR
jgi:hypothetical protein